jgi:hypothetical protein
MERHIFDINSPQGTKSLSNLRNSMRGLHMGDLLPLRPKASELLDDNEYSTGALAQAVWSGTGVTVATEATIKYNGNFALKLTIDGTGDRIASKTQTLDLSNFDSVTLWERVDVASSAFKFYVKDTSNNISYWDITSNGTISTWQQDTLDLSTPDSDSGTPADLTIIASWGFSGLDASKNYYIDDIKAICGLTVYVSGASIGNDYYQNCFIENTHLTYAGGIAPALVAPVANPRIDLLTIDSSGVLSWTAGAENSTPVTPTYPTNKIPICLVYCKTTMVKVVDYEDAATNPNEAYIYKDVRPLYALNQTKLKSGDTTKYIETLDAGIKMALGSDALGDIYYRGSTYLTRLALGAAGLGLFVNAAGNGIEWGSGIKIKVETRDMALSSGDVSYTGANFTPSKIIALSVSSTNLGFGWSDVTTQFGMAIYDSVSYDSSTTNFVIFRTSTNQQLGALKSKDSDGCTITWTKAASPSGIGTFVLIYIR